MTKATVPDLIIESGTVARGFGETYMSEVIYKDIAWFPGYRVGTDGTVWSCWRRTGSGSTQTNNWKRLRPGLCKRGGHPLVVLYVNGQKFTRYVHTLVLETFVGGRSNGMVCRHFPDQDPTNNNLNNLQWGTYVENQFDRIANETSNSGTQNGMHKLTEEHVREIRTKYLDGASREKLASEYAVSPATIYDAVNYITWKHVK